MERLNDEALATFLTAHSTWKREGDAIERTYKAASARAAISKLMRIADLAEGANHHPELTWVYNTLTIRLTTHDAGGLTTKDTHLAACVDDVLEDA
ncbi:MAG: 4a-hydroxytetrahydrobiopterin dehydratase [Myxococcota bacterium]